MKELHIGIKFEPWGDGAHIGALKEPPSGDDKPPGTVLLSDQLTIPVYLWWLDFEIPDEAIRQNIENVVRSYVERQEQQESTGEKAHDAGE